MADCTYRVPDLNASGDALYGPRICNQPFIDWAWEVHGFNGTYWQNGWGYDDVCNIRKPLARCLNAMWLLNYSAEDYTNEDWNSDALHWGPRPPAGTGARRRSRPAASGRGSGGLGGAPPGITKRSGNAGHGSSSSPGSATCMPR
jgi:hypothetical protein